MLRAVLVTLLVASMPIASLHAQRAGGMVSGHAGGAIMHSAPPVPHGSPAGSRFRHNFPNPALSGRFHHHRDDLREGFVPYGFYDDELYGNEQNVSDTAQNEPEPPLMMPPQRERPPAKAEVIEIPGAPNPAAAKPLPLTIFILTDGERLESQRFLLTASNLSISIHHQERNIPLDRLDLDATVAANHERGIDLRIPSDRNEISLRF